MWNTIVLETARIKKTRQRLQVRICSCGFKLISAFSAVCALAVFSAHGVPHRPWQPEAAQEAYHHVLEVGAPVQEGEAAPTQTAVGSTTTAAYPGSVP